MSERRFIQHLRTNEANVKPNSNEIEYGEIAINFKKDNETLFIKNDSDEIVEFVDKKYVDDIVNQRQEEISDLETIRSNAAKGATALQSIPAEYVTESELESKGYLTSVPSEYITATQLQNKGYLTGVPSEYITESELQGKGYLTSHQDISHLATKEELTGYTTDSEFNSLSNTVSEKADKTELFSKSYNDLTDKPTIPSVDGLASEEFVREEIEAIEYVTAVDTTETADGVSNDFVTSEQLDARGYATTASVNNEITTINNSIGVNTAGFTLADRITKLEDGYDAPDARANVLWIGTSIPAGDISFSNNGTTQSVTTDLGSNNYPKMVADVLGFNLYNNSRGSSFVCFYPSNEDGTANWASASDWSEYSSEVWKGYSLSASFAQVDEKFGPNGLNCPQWLINNFKSYSYESLIIPYIDGTLASCDTVVIDHGYNDRSIIINEASWHPGEGETQFAAGAGRDWLLKLQDPFETTLETETYFQGKWWNDESVSSKKYYMSAMIFLCKKIWAVNPKIKIIIGNYFTSKSNVFGAEFGNDRLGEFVHLANSAIASWLRVNCVEVWHHTGLYNRNVGGVNDYQNFCPDGVHPHSDSTGHSNKVIAGVYINALRGTLYK